MPDTLLRLRETAPRGTAAHLEAPLERQLAREITPLKQDYGLTDCTIQAPRRVWVPTLRKS